MVIAWLKTCSQLMLRRVSFKLSFIIKTHFIIFYYFAAVAFDSNTLWQAGHASEQADIRSAAQ